MGAGARTRIVNGGLGKLKAIRRAWQSAKTLTVKLEQKRGTLARAEGVVDTVERLLVDVRGAKRFSTVGTRRMQQRASSRMQRQLEQDYVNGM